MTVRRGRGLFAAAALVGTMLAAPPAQATDLVTQTRRANNVEICLMNPTQNVRGSITDSGFRCNAGVQHAPLMGGSSKPTVTGAVYIRCPNGEMVNGEFSITIDLDRLWSHQSWPTKTYNWPHRCNIQIMSLTAYVQAVVDGGGNYSYTLYPQFTTYVRRPNLQ